jgi:hypothetical protein
MICFARNLTKLISALPFCVFIVLLALSIIGLTAPPSSACCYDPPEYVDRAEQAQTTTADVSGQGGMDNATVPDVSEETQLLLYSTEPSEQHDLSSAGASVKNFGLIRRFLADGQYLRAMQMAEKQLETRPFDFQLWGLLKTIYSKMGLQNKTRTAAKNEELMNPRRLPPPQPAPPMSQQKRYVAKLLQAIGEYKPVE